MSLPETGSCIYVPREESLLRFEPQTWYDVADVAGVVLSFLSVSDIRSVAATNRAVNQASEDAELWRSLLDRDFGADGRVWTPQAATGRLIRPPKKENNGTAIVDMENPKEVYKDCWRSPRSAILTRIRDLRNVPTMFRYCVLESQLASIAASAHQFEDVRSDFDEAAETFYQRGVLLTTKEQLPLAGWMALASLCIPLFHGQNPLHIPAVVLSGVLETPKLLIASAWTYIGLISSVLTGLIARKQRLTSRSKYGDGNRRSMDLHQLVWVGLAFMVCGFTDALMAHIVLPHAFFYGGFLITAIAKLLLEGPVVLVTSGSILVAVAYFLKFRFHPLLLVYGALPSATYFLFPSYGPLIVGYGVKVLIAGVVLAMTGIGLLLSTSSFGRTTIKQKNDTNRQRFLILTIVIFAVTKLILTDTVVWRVIAAYIGNVGSFEWLPMLPHVALIPSSSPTARASLTLSSSSATLSTAWPTPLSYKTSPHHQRVPPWDCPRKYTSIPT